MTVVPKCAGKCGRDVRMNTDGSWRTYCRTCNGRVNGKKNKAKLQAGAILYRKRLAEITHARTVHVLRRLASGEMTLEMAIEVMIDIAREEYQRGYGAAKSAARARSVA